MTEDELAREEQRRLRAIEEAKARDRAEALASRGRAYENWLETLGNLREDFVRHRDLTEVVTRLREVVPGFSHNEHHEPLQDFLGWAEQHLLESDPFKQILLPNGERPDLSYSEWRDWNARNQYRLR